MRMQLNPNLARCATTKADPDIFFMDEKDDENYSVTKTRIALSICGQCPIQKQCLEFAIKEDMQGVWGGTTTRERIRITYKRPANFVPKFRDREKDRINLRQVNAIRALEVSVRDKDRIIKALETFNDLEPITIEIANLRINNPGVPLSELAIMAGITKDVFAGRLKRLLKRLETVA